MSKKSSIQKNIRRTRMSQRDAEKRQVLRDVIKCKAVSPEERFQAVLKLSKLPRNGAKNRVRNRCVLTGRPRGFYRKLNLSRIALRTMASEGLIPGMVKASW